MKAIVSRDGGLQKVSRYLLYIDRNLSEKILQSCSLYLFSKDFFNYKKISQSNSEIKEGIEKLRCLDAGSKSKLLKSMANAFCRYPKRFK